LYCDVLAKKLNMPGKSKEIEDAIRERFIEAVNQIRMSQPNIETIMKSVGDYQQGFTQMNSGKRYPTLKNIVLICQCYGVNANWLLFGTGETGLKSPVTLQTRLAFIEQELSLLKVILGDKKKRSKR
jgi:hypothetical protein